MILGVESAFVCATVPVLLRVPHMKGGTDWLSYKHPGWRSALQSLM